MSQLDRLLQICAQRSAGRPGHQIRFGPDDFVLVDAFDSVELLYLVGTLVDQDVLRERAGADTSYVVTAKGWDRLSPTPLAGIPGTCFVAMSFDPALTPAYDDGIDPALRACGFRLIRLDRVEHNDNINDKIIAELRSAQLVVADFTQHKGGVYFEAGFALGLGRTVIWTCRRDDFDDAHFDTKPYNHILWSTPADLQERLIDRIRATIPTANRE